MKKRLPKLTAAEMDAMRANYTGLASADVVARALAKLEIIQLSLTNKSYTYMVDSFVEQAVNETNKAVAGNPEIDFDKFYHATMNRLTREAGVRNL